MSKEERQLVILRKWVTKEELKKLYPDTEVEYEMHADGVKEKKCDFCPEPCRNTWCPTEEE